METESKHEPIEVVKKSTIVILETRIGIYPTPINSIVAIEKTQHSGLTIYTQEHTLTEVNNKLQRLKTICSDNFIYLNRQCIVNKTAIDHVIPKSRAIHIKIKDNELKEFTCSRSKLRELIKWLTSIAHTSRDELLSPEN